MSSEATQSAGVYEFLAWLETNKKNIIVGFCAAVVIGFGIAIYRWKVGETELAASDALLKLKASAAVGETPVSIDAAAYLQVARQYPGTTAGERALLFASSALFAEGKYDEAQKQFSSFLRDRPQSPFAAIAAYGSATCLEAQGKLDEALTAYQTLPVRYPNSSIVEVSKLAIARIQEAKKQPELALRVYDELTKASSAGGFSSAAAEARMRRDDLVAKFPELAKTNALATTLTNLPALAPGTNAVPAATNLAAPKP